MEGKTGLLIESLRSETVAPNGATVHSPDVLLSLYVRYPNYYTTVEKLAQEHGIESGWLRQQFYTDDALKLRYTAEQRRRGIHRGRRLADDEIVAIRADSRINRLIAADYGMSRRTIDRIKRGDTHAPKKKVRRTNYYRQHLSLVKVTNIINGNHHDSVRKLSIEDVIVIRQDERSDSEVAQDYGVSQASISNAKSGRTFKFVSGELSTQRGQFTDDQIKEIRSDLRTYEAIAADHGVDRAMIGYIKRGDVYKNVGGKITANGRRRKLSDDDIRAIRVDPRLDIRGGQRLIAKEYGISVGHVSAIKNGKRRRIRA